MKEYENGNPYIMLERQAAPNTSAADAMKPFAFDLRPGTTCAEADAVAEAMRKIITHVHFEETPVIEEQRAAA